MHDIIVLGGGTGCDVATILVGVVRRQNDQDTGARPSRPLRKFLAAQALAA